MIWSFRKFCFVHVLGDAPAGTVARLQRLCVLLLDTAR